MIHLIQDTQFDKICHFFPFSGMANKLFKKGFKQKDMATEEQKLNDTVEDQIMEETNDVVQETKPDESAENNPIEAQTVSDDTEVKKLQIELQEQKDKYLRLMAEFDNFRRRTAKERIELTQTAGKDIIVSLLDVLDDTDRAEKQMASGGDLASQKEGIQLVFNKFRSIMQAKGVKAMNSLNEEFDVEKHEAITEIKAPTKELQGKVLDEVQKGYYLNEKLIRFAKVVVGN